MKAKNLTLSTKFTLTIGFIVLVFCIAFSMLLYYHLKERIIEEANERTRIILTQMDAIGDYVKDELRPALFEFLKGSEREDFIAEAMSTTFVRLHVMERFRRTFKDYIYKRVSTYPLNPQQRADGLHERLITYFQGKKEEDSWNGIVEINGEEFLIRAKPVIVEKGCLVCHGRLKDAPKALVKRYGRDRDFPWREGDVMGVESVAVPLATAISRIKEIVVSTFLIGVIALFFLFLSIQGAFYGLVSRPLRRLTILFKDIVDGTEPLSQGIRVTRGDEIGDLINSFNRMSSHLYEAQEGLKKSADTLKTIFEGISDPLALVSPNCKVELTNQAYRDWMAKGTGAVFTSDCNPPDCEDDVLMPVCLLRRLIREGKPISEYWQEGDRYYYIHLYPIFNEDGGVIKVVHYVKDITERRNIEEQMRVAEKLAAIGQLSAGIAHEINNPLGGIRLCFNNLINTEMDEKTRQLHIEVIKSGLSRIQDIVRQLLDFSKQTDLLLSPVSVATLIEDVLRLTEYLITKRGINVIKVTPEDIPDIMVDRNKIEQAFLNIVINAIQAMDEKGGVLRIEASVKDNSCIISFSDTGSGIPPNILHRIFEPFFTTKPVGEGTGLGLSVSKSIIEQHNGNIDVETSDKGTTFKIELPIRAVSER
ncbi:MAG: DUF3365 domain-containing protein [Thermodesulfovibrionia bacterium]